MVLDTNVCLDLFLFGDARCAALHQALLAGRVRAVVDEACYYEWRAVLGYPQLKLEVERHPELLAAYRGLAECLGELPRPPEAISTLPRCADPDDQKFLELALLTGARWLITKDKKLLKLNRRTVKAGLYRILLPEHWAQETGTS